MFAFPAHAQDAAATEEPSDDIVVTGSRIVNPALEQSSPVAVIGEDELNFRQPVSVEEVLRELPGVRPSIGPGVNNGSDGSATVDLRGIGTNRTLVLMDGRRIVPFGLDGLTDTNNIPVALLQRVDITTGGASTVYGADAVAGVVNFITRRDFEGIVANAQYRISERGDAARFRADVTVGGNFADGRGNAVLSVGYTKADPLLHTQRSISEVPISSANGLFSGATAAQVTIFGSPNNAALGLPASIFGAVVNPATGRLQAATPADTYNTNIGTYFQTPLDRINVYAKADYEIADGIEFYSTAFYNRNEVRLQLASSGTFGNTYRLSLNNAYLPAGVRNQLCAGFDTNAAVTGIQPISQADCDAAAAVRGGPGTPGYLEIPVIAQRRFTEYGPRGNPIVSQVFQVQGGFRGNITPSLTYDVSAQFGETRQNQTRENWGSFSKVQQALRSFRTVGGTPVCVDTTNNCVPLNLFGQNGTITPEMLSFIDLDALINRVTRQTVITGSIAGDLFGLASPFAENAIGFAVGAEYRKISAASQPDGASQIQGEVLGTGARTPPDAGEYSVKEVFGEIIVPLVEDKPFFYRLTAEGGIRYSDYTTTGGSTTWKAGGSWEPYRGFKFRGMYQIAVRSPNIQELFQSPVQGLGNLTTDPCQGANPTASAGLTALCVATGAPAGTIGGIPAPTSGQINVTTAGNATLDVEEARTYTLGGVFTPEFMPGFALTVDYFNIRVDNAITQPLQADILNGCYSAALNPTFENNSFCGFIRRNPLTGSLNGAGETPGVILSSSNLGVIQTAGIDFGVTQRIPLDQLGLNTDNSITMSFNGTWLDYYHFQATPNAINRDCTGYYSPSGCTNPRAEWRYNGRLTYSGKNYDISMLWNHMSAVQLEPFLATRLPGNTPQPGGPNPAPTNLQSFVLNGVQYTNVPTGGIAPQFRQIGAYDLFDLALRVQPTDELELTLTVDNLFDRQPPLVGSGVGGTAFNSGNTFPTLYDPIGRSFTMGARLRF
ncbi:TonB-dependent receptor [Sphingomonas sp. BGYR3]|uniref:TonB-dependent receptor plug domain-containing protein n=1 Tax=Sphingomonas sp. BGYR3 TaxID=2975483 RepID=UPI0021A772F3|nr:TonB-dependent receptor [Sphingomonas sp. BGYR3]MDG5487692.1 TonB-dependent receptor [Sphingomonas sp. BGYR3]